MCIHSTENEGCGIIASAQDPWYPDVIYDSCVDVVPWPSFSTIRVHVECSVAEAALGEDSMQSVAGGIKRCSSIKVSKVDLSKNARKMY